MRSGNNPQRHKKITDRNYSHRVIIPVYIPEIKGYYIDSFKIFKLCFQSINKTINFQTAITIVNNGCCKEVVNYLNELYKNNLVDELINTQKVGKLNAILKGVRSSKEPYLTITDADVLFKNNWVKETMHIFNTFNKAAVVGIVPQFKLYESLSHNVIFDNFFNKNLKYTKVKDVKGLKLFYKSIGWNDDYNQDYLNYNLSLTKNNTIALIGSGHFVATYKRNLFDNNLPFSNYLLGGTSETIYLDLPPSKKNLWKFTTDGNYAFHMGNTLQDWMVNFEKKIDIQNNVALNFPQISNTLRKNKPISYFIKQRFFSRLFAVKWFKKMFYRAKGLSNNIAKNY